MMTIMTGMAAAAMAMTMAGGDLAGAGEIRAKFPPPPVATITEPAAPTTRTSLHGKPVKIKFAGKGTDAAKNPISGTRYRWTAYGTGGVKKTLCVGSGVPTPGPVGDKIAIYRNCASFTAELGMLAGDITSTTWKVKLEVFGGWGTVGSDTEKVKLVYIAL